MNWARQFALGGATAGAERGAPSAIAHAAPLATRSRRPIAGPPNRTKLGLRSTKPSRSSSRQGPPPERLHRRLCGASTIRVRHAAHLGLPDDLVGDQDKAVTNGLGVDEAHGLFVARLVEEALAGAEHDGEDD